MACTVEAVAIVLAILSILVLRTLLKRENAKLDRRAHMPDEDVTISSDLRLQKFRYLY